MSDDVIVRQAFGVTSNNGTLGMFGPESNQMIDACILIEFVRACHQVQPSENLDLKIWIVSLPVFSLFIPHYPHSSLPGITITSHQARRLVDT